MDGNAFKDFRNGWHKRYWSVSISVFNYACFVIYFLEWKNSLKKTFTYDDLNKPIRYKLA